MNSPYTREWLEDVLPGGRWQPNGEYRCAVRDERAPSCHINLEKRSFCDFGGNRGKLSDLLRELNIPDPYQSSKEQGPDFAAIIRNGTAKQNAARDKKTLKARRLWDSSAPATAEHPYLKAKGISPEGLRVTSSGVLLVPAHDILTDELCGVERIDLSEQPDRKKMHLGQKTGAFFLAGSLDADGPILVCEGTATAASLHALTGWTAASCFGAAQLASAARLLRKRFPGRDIAVAPDADDTGRKAAAQCRSAGFKVVELPPESRNGLDWNDVMVEQGLEPAKALFREAWSKATVKQPETPEEEERPENGITLLRGDQIQYIAREHLVKGLIQQNSLNVVFGISGCAKTFFCVDMALSIASGQAFLGRQTKEGPVIYVCSEGADELAKRLDAWDLNKASRDVSYKNIPFYYVPHAVILPQEKQREALVSSVMEKVENELGGVLPVAIFIDTLARCSEGDENSNEDMSTFIAAADDLKARLGNPAVTILHHTPKSNPEDMRGASALRGALNTAICLALRGTGTPEEQSILMRCDKQKDLPIFPDQALARVQVELPYTNFYGDPETSCIIEEREKTPDMVKPLTDNQQQAYTAFNKAAIEAGVLDDAGRFMGVSRDSWREYFYIEYTGESKDSTRRGAFKSGIDGLIKRGKIKKVDEFLFRLDGPAAELLESEFAKKLKLSGRWGVGDRCEALPTTENLNPEVVGVALRCTTLGGTTPNAQRKGEEGEEKNFSSPRGTPSINPKDIELDDAIKWAETQSGLLESIERRARERGGDMIEPEALFEAGVKIEYAKHLEADRGDTRADDSSSCGEATYEEALTWAKTQTGLIEELEARAEEVAKGGLPPERIFESSVRAQYSAFLAEQKKPAGVSIRELAERAGVDAEAVREELESWQACGRLRITGDSVLIVEGGKGYPGEDGEDEDHREDGDKALDDSSPGGRGPGLFGGGAPAPLSEQARRFLAGR